jgi:hypothetical protein
VAHEFPGQLSIFARIDTNRGEPFTQRSIGRNGYHRDISLCKAVDELVKPTPVSRHKNHATYFFMEECFQGFFFAFS